MLFYSSKCVPDTHSCLSVTFDPPQYASPASSVCTLLNVLEGKKFISYFETFTSLISLYLIFLWGFYVSMMRKPHTDEKVFEHQSDMKAHIGVPNEIK